MTSTEHVHTACACRLKAFYPTYPCRLEGRTTNLHYPSSATSMNKHRVRGSTSPERLSTRICRDPVQTTTPYMYRQNNK